MHPLISDYLDNAARFTDVVDAGGDWTAPSPCEGWTAHDVLDHVLDSQRDFLATRDVDPGPRPAGTPRDAWHEHLEGMRRLLADDELVGQEYDGYFGRTSIADTMASFYGFDMVVHRWDLGRALGQEVRWSEEEMERLEKAIAGFGDALYSPGVSAPALDVRPDADRQTRILALLGRRG